MVVTICYNLFIFILVLYDMNNESERLLLCVEVAVELFQVMESVINEYLAADKDEALYNPDELLETWVYLKSLLQKKDVQIFNDYLKNALDKYIHPLPVRPCVSLLLSKRWKMLACFHENLELGQNFIEISDQLFIDALAQVLKWTLPSHENLNNELIQELKTFFVIAIRQRLDAEYSTISETLSSTPMPAYDAPVSPTKFAATPSLFNSNMMERYDGYDSDGNEILEIIVPHYTPQWVPQNVPTPSLFSLPEFKTHTTWDPEVNEWVIETIIP